MTGGAASITSRLIVGLEVHVELATRSKMFSSAANPAHPENYEAAPNTLTDPVVLALPGTLPVINRRAVEMAVLVGLALDCKIARQTKWDRKSYFYPDLPKNYQISQYDLPLCHDGAIESPVSGETGAAMKRIRIIRAHLEEDAGKLLHEAPGGGAIDHSIVDLNRAGTPLLEIVTHPDFSTAEEVAAFAQMLRSLCVQLGVTEGVMQRGQMRFEPNINLEIEREGRVYRTPIVEIKNLNSFRSLLGAVKYEEKRQLEEWMETGKTSAPGSKSTRGWDDVKGVTVLQREKEEAHDYRYFPDPDLVPVVMDEAWLSRIKGQLTEPPLARQQRYTAGLKVGANEARQIIDDPGLTRYFESLLAEGVEARRAAAVLLNNLAKRANEKGSPVHELGIGPGQVKVIEGMLAGSEISATAADQLYGLLCEGEEENGDPRKLAEVRGLLQVSDDSALERWVEQAVGDNSKSVEAYRAGKESALNALLGAVMKLSKGKANPGRVKELLKQKLSG